MSDFTQFTPAPAVHQVILQQLGGNRFLAMTGSKNLVYSAKDNNYLSMKLARNKSGAHFLKIILTDLDYYTLIFTRVKHTFETLPLTGTKVIKDMQIVEVKRVEMVDCDNLQAIFTEVTGLYTHL